MFAGSPESAFEKWTRDFFFERCVAFVDKPTVNNIWGYMTLSKTTLFIVYLFEKCHVHVQHCSDN